MTSAQLRRPPPDLRPAELDPPPPPGSVEPAEAEVVGGEAERAAMFRLGGGRRGHGGPRCGDPSSDPLRGPPARRPSCRRLPRPESPRAPGASLGLFQRDLTSPPTAACPGGAR
jgi:hypothetical protein